MMNFDMDNEFGWSDEPETTFGPRNPGGFRNERYNNAYGDYRGGYGRYGGPPPRPFGPRPGLPSLLGPMHRPRMGPPMGPPPFMWGRGFGPNGPPGPPPRRNLMDDRAIKYLIKCGVTKDNMRNLPKDLLELIEPQYCGLCGHSFDSFAMSRLHYISKNHLKNQKKWIAHQTEYGAHHSKEIPIKSRDLYCELCDVHITSKNHSDSHYAGKPHRSIVEGRKNPRNPILLQPGMQARVDQLVRREKKFLKVVEDVEEEFNETKSAPPELFCDICKTTVTCSEQMTMHMNGKRHLNKEKQHILKMMTGSGAANYEAAGNTDEVYVKQEDSEEKDTEKKEIKTEDCEWDNGGEKWEETE